MSNIVINGTTYNGVESITVKDTSGSAVKYTKGERPSGTIEITENGTHNVADYESANVNVSATLSPEIIAGIWKAVLGDESQIVIFAYYIFSLKENENGEKMMKMFSIDDFESGTFTELPYTISGNNVIVDENSDEPLEFTYSFEDGKMTLNSESFPVPLTKVITGMGENEDNINPLADITENGLYTPKTLNDTDLLFFGANVNVPTSSGGIDRLQWKCDNMKSLKYEFDGYKGTDLSILEGLDTSQVENWYYAFQNCSNVENLQEMDCSNATTLYNAFYGCSKLKNFPIKNFPDNVNFNYAFYRCSKLNSTTPIDLGKPRNIDSVFAYCTALSCEVIVDLTNCTDIGNAFNHCEKITKITLNNIGTISDLNGTFQYCSRLQEVDLPTIVVPSGYWSFTFGRSGSLKTIKTFDLINVTNVNQVFDFNYDLENLDLRNIKATIKLGQTTSWGAKLTNASLLNTAQELWDNTDNALGGTRTLTLSNASKTRIQNIYVKLVDVTDEMIAQDQYITNKKPCVECASTDEGAMTVEEYIISKNWSIA